MNRKNAVKPAKNTSVPSRPDLDSHRLRQGKNLQDLIAEQGIKPVENLEDMAAPPGSLWRDDAELEAFLTELRRRRQEGV